MSTFDVIDFAKFE